MAQYTVIDGIAYPIADGPAPVVAAPAAARVASPFAASQRVSVAGVPVDTRPAILQGLPLRDARKAAAIHALPGYSCSVDADWNHDGAVITGAAHGFATERKTGTPCPSTQDDGCKGTIR